MTERLLIGSGNRGKVAELRRLLQGLDVELLSVDELESPPPEPHEHGDTYEENAIAKARAYASATGLSAIADDSGLEVDALGGAPGVRSARYAATPAERIARLLEELRDVEDRGARFVCVIALARPDGAVETFDGEVRGEIARAPSGENGFGYDPVFVIAGDGRTMAELADEDKDRLSHRGLAASKLRARLAAEPR